MSCSIRLTSLPFIDPWALCFCLDVLLGSSSRTPEMWWATLGEPCDHLRAWLRRAIFKGLVVIFSQFFFTWFYSLLRNLFLTLLYGKTCQGFANGKQKTAIAHFFWLTNLICKWQLLSLQELFSIK